MGENNFELVLVKFMETQAGRQEMTVQSFAHTNQISQARDDSSILHGYSGRQENGPPAPFGGCTDELPAAVVHGDRAQRVR